MFFDPIYLLFMAPAMIFALYATIKTKLTFSKYSKVASSSGMTGAEAAQRLLSQQGVNQVK